MSQLHNECNSASKNENFRYPEVSNEVIEGSRDKLKVSRSLRAWSQYKLCYIDPPKIPYGQEPCAFSCLFLMLPRICFRFLNFVKRSDLEETNTENYTNVILNKRWLMNVLLRISLN